MQRTFSLEFTSKQLTYLLYALSDACGQCISDDEFKENKYMYSIIKEAIYELNIPT